MNVAAKYVPGRRVLVVQPDPAGHTRAPRYIRGRAGTVVAQHGIHTLPDSAVGADARPRVEPVYAVRFAARDLFGHGDHHVTVNLWESYLEEVEA